MPRSLAASSLDLPTRLTGDAQPSRRSRVLARRVTQKDIAALAGVHNTTVSLALRNDPSIPAITRRRITEVANQLGYRPDPALSALVSYRRSLDTKRLKTTIAYATCGASRWAWQDSRQERMYFEGAQDAAKERGLQLEHFWLDEPQMSPKRLAEILYNRGITGMILSAASPRVHPFIDFVARRLQVVSVASYGIRPSGNCVTCDLIGDIRRAMRKAFRSGYRRPALVIEDPAIGNPDHALWLGFHTEKNGNSNESSHSTFCSSATESISPFGDGLNRQTRFNTWLEKARPDVLFGSYLLISDLLTESTTRSPNNLALVDPCLTDEQSDIAGVRQQPKRIGQVAIELLAPRLGRAPRSTEPTHTTTLIEGIWVPGATLPASSSQKRRSVSFIPA